MKKLRAGVLGAGHLGKIHLRLLQESDSYELMGFYDPDTTAAKEKVILPLVLLKSFLLLSIWLILLRQRWFIIKWQSNV